MPAVPSLQAPNVALGTVSRPPQTSSTPAAQGAPFVRMSRKAQVLTSDQTASPSAFGGNNVITWKPAGGYMRRARIEVLATGGSASNAPFMNDAPYTVFSTLQFRDSQGALIVNTDGYGLALINAYGGQVGTSGVQLPSNAVEYSTVTTTTGNFQLTWYMPLELNSQAYCALPSLSAAAQPWMQIQYGTSAAGTVYQTAPQTTVPALETRIYTEYWTVPVANPTAGPPGLGSTAQWQWGISAQKPAFSANSFAVIPLVNTFIHTLILLNRTSDTLSGTSNANPRNDNWPTSDLTIRLDNVPIEYESFLSRRAKMHQAFDYGSNDLRPTGAITYTFRDSVHQPVSQIDTGDYWLYTTAATLLEVGGTWGSTGTSPNQVYAYAGQVWPQAVVPYGHLAV